MFRITSRTAAWSVSARSLSQSAFLVLVLLALLAPTFVGAQATGNVYVEVTDSDGSALPGVQLELSGIGAPRTATTDGQGIARFLGLDPGTYVVAARLDGFSTVEYPGVSVATARNTAIELELQAAVTDTITVTSESPLLDERRLSSGTQVSAIELEKIPSARDPWSLLSQTPGVMVDRINVGGSESGQQSGFRASGVSGTQNDFMMDGVSITDMSATGASPGYYDFDQFAEMSFTTGGTDVTKSSAGVQVNLITKRGTNEFRGSARFYNEKSGGYFGGALKQSQPDLGGELYTEGGQTSLVGARIRGIEDLGFEAGGAVIKDRFWLWGSWGQNDVKQNAASGDPDDTILENSALKANGQIVPQNSAVLSWNNGDKLKFGRGAGVIRPRPTTWNQRGPTAVYRAEDTHIFGSNLFVTGTYSHVDGGFELISIGQSGNGLNPGELDGRFAGGVWQDNFLSGGTSRPADEFKADSSYFFATGNVSHEVKIGGRYREFDVNSDFKWGPRDTFSADWGATVYARGDTGFSTAEYTSLWAQDTISLGKLTVNLGLRYDDQTGANQAYTRAAHPVRDDLFPEVPFSGTDAGFSWQSITPRLGATYAVGEDHDTLLRASFSQFADQMQAGFVTRNSPLVTSYAYTNTATGQLYNAVGYDPDDTARIVNQNDPGLDAPLTTELLLGVEHALLPEFVIGLSLTARQVEDILDFRQLVDDGGGIRVARADDFEVVNTLSGTLPRTNTNYSVDVWDLRNGVDWTFGTLMTNGARERSYEGASITFTKRLANRWMARGFFNYGDAEWEIDRNDYNLAVERNAYRGGGARDGDLYLTRSTGSGKGERFLQSTWSYNLTGMYQVAPDRAWGFNLAASIDGREGYPVPYYQRNGLSFNPTANINLVSDFDSLRLDDVVVANLRLEKEFNLTGPVNMTVGLDAFNIGNENTGLSYVTRAALANSGHLADNVSPRIYRLGVRLAWK